MTIKVDKGIPIPERRRGPGAPEKYPWREMAVGDSFFVPGITSAKFGGTPLSMRNAGRVFARRSWTEDGVKGVRVWRTK